LKRRPGRGKIEPSGLAEEKGAVLGDEAGSIIGRVQGYDLAEEPRQMMGSDLRRKSFQNRLSTTEGRIAI